MYVDDNISGPRKLPESQVMFHAANAEERYWNEVEQRISYIAFCMNSMPVAYAAYRDIDIILSLHFT